MSAQVLNGEQTFLDQNGAPLSGGFVYMYTPNTSNFSTTWQDPGLSIVNTNPIVLDQAGRAKIWGNMEYRQVVTDQFGNVQWDTITQAGISGQVIGDLDITGNLTTNGNLQVNGTSNFSGLAVFNDIHTRDFTSTDSMTVNFLSGVQGFFTHFQAGNILANDGNFNTLTVNSSANINSLLVDNVTTLNGPLNMHSNLNVQAGYSIDIASPGGIQTDHLQSFTVGQPVLCGSDFTPASNLGQNLGLSALAWNDVVAHNYITVSTNPSSAVAEDGFLDIVKGILVKTEPHLGIAKEDLQGNAWAQVEVNGGVNYNMLVGALWKALQELNAKFDAYVAAHP